MTILTNEELKMAINNEQHKKYLEGLIIQANSMDLKGLSYGQRLKKIHELLGYDTKDNDIYDRLDMEEAMGLIKEGHDEEHKSN